MWDILVHMGYLYDDKTSVISSPPSTAGVSVALDAGEVPNRPSPGQFET